MDPGDTSNSLVRQVGINPAYRELHLGLKRPKPLMRLKDCKIIDSFVLYDTVLHLER